MKRQWISVRAGLAPFSVLKSSSALAAVNGKPAASRRNSESYAGNRRTGGVNVPPIQRQGAERQRVQIDPVGIGSCEFFATFAPFAFLCVEWRAFSVASPACVPACSSRRIAKAPASRSARGPDLSWAYASHVVRRPPPPGAASARGACAGISWPACTSCSTEVVPHNRFYAEKLARVGPAAPVARCSSPAALHVQGRAGHRPASRRVRRQPDLSARALRPLSPHVRHARPAAAGARHGRRLAVVDRLLAVRARRGRGRPRGPRGAGLLVRSVHRLLERPRRRSSPAAAWSFPAAA